MITKIYLTFLQWREQCHRASYARLLADYASEMQRVQAKIFDAERKIGLIKTKIATNKIKIAKMRLQKL
jgi:hypothetical protein